jgi:hypothetical protein
MDEEGQVKANASKSKALSKWKDIIDITHNIIVILAIISAGLWFYLKGQIRPKVDIKHEIVCQNIHNNNNLVNVVINLKNIGETPIELIAGTVRLQKITPLDDDLKKDIDSGVDIIDRKHGIVLKWPYACKEGKYEIAESIFIEVGETRRIDYDFIIPSDVTMIKIYSYFEEKNKGRWRRVTISHVKQLMMNNNKKEI